MSLIPCLARASHSRPATRDRCASSSVEEAKRAPCSVKGTNLGSTRASCQRADKHEVAASVVQRSDHDSLATARGPARPAEDERRFPCERRMWKRVRRAALGLGANGDDELRPLLKVWLVRSRRENVEPLGRQLGKDIGEGRVDIALRRGTRQAETGEFRTPTARSTRKHNRVLVAMRNELRRRPRARHRDNHERRNKHAKRRQPARLSRSAPLARRVHPHPGRGRASGTTAGAHSTKRTPRNDRSTRAVTG